MFSHIFYLHQKTATSCDLDIALGHIAILINCEALSPVMVLCNQALRFLKLKQLILRHSGHTHVHRVYVLS